jgi:nucleoid-associated protein YgaU
MRRRWLIAVLWVAALGGAAVALQWAGRGPLASPPLTEPGQWSAWVADRDPLVAAFSVLRLGALAGLWYVVAVTVVGAVVRAIGAASLVRLTDRFTVAPVRRMLAGSLSLGLAASGVVAVAAPALRSPVAAAEQATTTTTTTVASAPTANTVTMHRLDATEQPAAPIPEVVPVTTAPADRWTVKSGECFWSIAESVLADHWHRAPTDAEIIPYWERLIAANRLELAHRDDPDLVFPGQVFVVPAP